VKSLLNQESEQVRGLEKLTDRRSLRISGILLVLFLAGCASLIRPNFETEVAKLRAGNYQLDPEHAYVHFRIAHLGLSTIVGRFNTVDAALDFDPAELSKLRLDGTLETASIDMNNASLDERLRGSSWFDATRFPEAVFVTTAVTPGTGNAFKLTGDLTLKGITKPVTFDALFIGGADNLLTGKYTVGFAANAVISRAAYGIDGFAALIGDEVAIEIHAEFQRN